MLSFFNLAFADEMKNTADKQSETGIRKIDYGKIQPDEYFLGNKDAPVTLIAYLSFSCPHCAMFASDIISKLEKEYSNTNKVKIAVRLVAMDKAAYQAVSLVNCTPYNTQPKMQNLLFSKQQNWLFAANPEKELQKIAKIAGINEERFQTCLTDKVFEDKFLTQQQEVHQQFTLNATPMIIINGKKLEEIPDYPHIEEAIERSLRRL